jgi:prepilin-type N-terminal cleavage/methylation domain-containing protein
VRRRGLTLIESLVVLAVLSIVLGTAALGFPGMRREAAADSWTQALRRAQVRALESGRAVNAGDPSRPVLFLPDGRGIGAGVDPLTGVTSDAAR